MAAREQQLDDLHNKPDLSRHRFKSLLDFLVADAHIQGHTSEDLCQLDPRDGAMITYAEHRSLRKDEQPNPVKTTPNKSCPICENQLTNVVDYAEQSEGFTFISQNMFPIFYPKNLNPKLTARMPLYPDPEHLGRLAFGLHLLQWTSSIHSRDWHNIPFNDALITLLRLAKLEHKVLLESGGYLPFSNEGKGIHGYVSIIKNYGAAAGASLSHGHQQIAISNIMPQRTFNNFLFHKRHKQTFSEYLIAENPTNLTVAEQGSMKVIMPYFMRRPFNVMIIAQTQAEYLYELADTELMDMTAAIQRVIKTFHLLLPSLGKDVSFNMVIHSGPNNNIYIEFFPVIQASGGFEQMGLWVCQLSAIHATNQFRELYDTITIN